MANDEPPSSQASKTPEVANPTYIPLSPDPAGFKTFAAFYPFYLGEHSHVVCRRLHLVGTSISGLVLLRTILALLPKIAGERPVASTNTSLDALKLKAPLWKYLLASLLPAYFMAWVGHFFFEKNRPATFKYPLYSLRGDLRMLYEVVTLQRSA